MSLFHATAPDIACQLCGELIFPAWDDDANEITWAHVRDGKQACPKKPLTDFDDDEAIDEFDTDDCDHMVYVNEGKPVLMHASLRVTFCPKCGEKL